MWEPGDGLGWGGVQSEGFTTDEILRNKMIEMYGNK